MTVRKERDNLTKFKYNLSKIASKNLTIYGGKVYPSEF